MNTNTVLERILQRFAELSAIPRRSGHEYGVCAWLQEWAESRGWPSVRDAALNVRIRVPASAGAEAAPTVVIQGHMDMVCEKTAESAHDFARDPIQLVREGDWLRANQTTLGADNGAALALVMALVDDPELRHPALELFFTADEETGLGGVQALTPEFLQGRILLNLDSEEDGVFIIGCAGGRETHIQMRLDVAPVPPGHTPLKLEVAGLSGGHSGIDIHRRRGNAIKLLARALNYLGAPEVRLVSIQGGTAHNAIPRQAESLFSVPAAEADHCRRRLTELSAVLRAEYATVDPALRLEWRSPPQPVAQAWDADSSRRLLNLLLGLPHGVAGTDYAMPHLVETSNNLALLRSEGDSVRLLSSQRSSIASRLDEHTQSIEAVARLAGAEVTSRGGYPGWQPRADSDLLRRCRELYQHLFGESAKVEVIHAGLECGVIASKYPDMNMISYGPTIHNAHTPQERLYLPSLVKVYRYTAALLHSLS